MVKNQEKSCLAFVDICFRSSDMSFQSLRNLEKKCGNAPLTKSVTSQLGFPFIQYLNLM